MSYSSDTAACYTSLKTHSQKKHEYFPRSDCVNHWKNIIIFETAETVVDVTIVLYFCILYMHRNIAIYNDFVYWIL